MFFRVFGQSEKADLRCVFGWVVASVVLSTAAPLSAVAAEGTISSRCRYPPWAASRERCTTAAAQERIENVEGAATYEFDAHDNGGHGLDGLKAVPFGRAFLGVYHSTVNGVFYEHLGYSYDLLHWRFRCDLDTNASQATITRLPDGSWLVGYEHSVPTDHGWINLRFRWYADDDALLTCRPVRQYDAPRTLARTAEGTPNFYGVDWRGSIVNSSVRIGLHYLDDSARVDREASATLRNFRSLSAKKAARYDALFEDFRFKGNFGDRDAFAFGNRSYIVFEAQRKPFDFATWRTFLYEPATGRAYELAMNTPGHSRAFGNPAVSSVTLAGRRYLFVTQFVFSEGAAPGEAGELLYLVDAAPA